MDTLAEAPRGRARKSIHWFRFFYAVWLEDCRKAQLSPEEVGVYIEFICLMWTDQARIVDDIPTIARRLGFDVRQVKRILAQLVAKGLLVRAAGTIWNPRADGDIAQLRDSYPVANKDLSRKPRKNNNSVPVDLDSDLDPSSSPQQGRDEADEIKSQFEVLWQAWPESEYKSKKTDCLDAYRAAVSGTSGFEPITPAELLAAVEAHARKNRRQPKFAGAPRKWLSNGGWLDYVPARRVDCAGPEASNLPLWETPERFERGGYTFEERLVAKCRKHNGWDPEFGPSPTSGVRTKLHERIACTPGLLRDLEALGIEFPSCLQDIADMADDASRAPLRPPVHLAVVDGRAIA